MTEDRIQTRDRTEKPQVLSYITPTTRVRLVTGTDLPPVPVPGSPYSIPHVGTHGATLGPFGLWVSHLLSEARSRVPDTTGKRVEEGATTSSHSLVSGFLPSDASGARS